MANKVFEQILKKRGFDSGFLKPKYEKLSELVTELPDITTAAERILAARDKGEKVLIYGDYDVDGVTATAIIRETLGLIGFDVAQVLMMLPDRFTDGYGMSARLVERARAEGVQLVVTVDCGSNNAEIIEALLAAGIETVVTDHHELSAEAPGAAVAVVNPKRPDFRKEVLARQAKALEKEDAVEVKAAGEMASLMDLSGAGVAFCLALALSDRGEIAAGREKWLLDLAAIGTMCDAMPIATFANRIICYFGMIVLSKTRRAGLLALMRVAKTRKITSEAVGFQIGPRLNAAGRMETAELALKLLLTQSKTEAEDLAQKLELLNRERKKQQQAAITEVAQRGVSSKPVIVVKGDWHEGVLGIIAGKLTETYRKPSFVLTEVGEVLKGSGRSFGEYNLALALSECQDLIVSGGGHAAAAGVKLEKGHFEEFCKRLNDYYARLKLTDQERFLLREVDMAIDDLSELSLDLVDSLRQLEPYGEGNPVPAFLLTDALVLDVSKMGESDQHLRMLVTDGKNSIKLVAFYANKDWFLVQPGEKINVVAELMENEWQGTRSVEGRIVEIR